MHDRNVCYHHGGKAGRKPSHARYSRSVPRDLAERYEYFKADPDILSLKPELALSRAWFERFQSTFIEGSRINSEQGEELRRWFDQISRIAERTHKILYGEQYTITVEGLTATIARIADIINTAFEAGGTTEEIRQRIVEGIGKLGGGE